MTIFSLYIYDRHCECIYYQNWHRTLSARSEPATKLKPNVHRLPPPLQQQQLSSNPNTSDDHQKASIFDTQPVQVNDGRIVSRGQQQQQQQQQQSLPAVTASGTGTGTVTGVSGSGSGSGTGLPFDEEAKLVYGVIISLRNMVKKLSGRDELFTSYSTPFYKLHLYETLTNYKFVLLSSDSSDSLRFVLRQIYVGPFLEYVVRNPLVDLDSRSNGIDNDQFRAAVDKHIRGLSMFT